MANPNDFLLNTDYEMDKIIYFYEGKIVDDGQHYVNISIDDNFLPLVFGVWSYNKDFSDCHTFGFKGAYIDYAIFEGYLTKNVELSAQQHIDGNGNKTTHIVLDRETISGDFYVRIYGFEPEDSHRNLAATSGHASTFILNTDYNYRKLFKKGKVELVKNPDQTTGYDPMTIPHNLGYKPQVMIWIEDVSQSGDGGEFHNINWGDWQTMDSDSGLQVNNNDITYYPTMFQGTDVRYLHYRIYYDEAQ